MIRFEEKDSDPYTRIMIYEDDERKAGSLVAFTLDSFIAWVDQRAFPETVQEAVNLLETYGDLTKKAARDSTQEILASARKEEAKSYSEREAELKSKGYSEHEIHVQLFPEEYDFMLDDHVDAKLRKQGHNPMSSTYIARINARREAEGIPPFRLNE